MTDSKKSRTPELVLGPAINLDRRLIDGTLRDVKEIVKAEIGEYVESLRAESDDLLDKFTAAKFLRVSVQQVDRLCRDHALPYHRVGDVKRFDREELRAWFRASAR